MAVLSTRRLTHLIAKRDFTRVRTLSPIVECLCRPPNNAPRGESSKQQREVEPPREDWRSLSKGVAERFPAYGYYPVADLTASPGEAAMTGDAIDDILDITLAMREVVWRAENFGIDDAVWYFRLDDFHWGRHARELALYLHARQF